jgi:tetratricopeptide (TPR) repeat protein
MWASFSRALADDMNGNAKEASEAYVSALAASSASADPTAPLVAWVAVRLLQDLRTSVSDLYDRHRAVLDGLLDRPMHLGWRAVAELQEWRAADGYARSAETDASYDAEIVRRTGCAGIVRLAGPFGHGVPQDRSASFPAERPGPWPSAWPPDAMRGSIPRVLSVSQQRCLAVADEQVQDGVFYAESFFVTQGERDLIVAVQGAVAIWIDDHLVLTRAIEEWGSWQRFGVHVRVADGRHRILARVLSAMASVRFLNPDGTAAGVAVDGVPAAPYSMARPRTLADPNPIDAITRAAAAGRDVARDAPIEGALAAYAAHSEQMDDVASAIMLPLSEPPDAAPLALELASEFCVGDPSLSQDVRSSRERTLRERALSADKTLWRSQIRAILDTARKQGLADAVEPLQSLAKTVPAEPQVVEQLAQVYAQLGWRTERLHALMDLTERFPDDVSALLAYLDALDDDGPPDEAERVAARIRRLDPTAEVDLDRALGRHDYATAIHELQRLAKRSPKDRQLAARLAEVLARSGDSAAAVRQIETALTKQPLNSDARFRLADRRLAGGESGALRRALAAALQVGAPHDDLRAAIDLVEGATNLEPYREDGLAVIREFQDWERSGHHLDGTSARILDYGAIWVHDDGSSDMLEHEIQKIQSQEAINAESEAELPTGLILRMRVVKVDGRVLEPEPVAGKATLTLPHLDIGDFVEIEHITREPNDGAKGHQYHSPHWFFREADKGYWRSKFIVVVPGDKPVEVETYGHVPPPKMTREGHFVSYHWRVDLSPPAELEPDSPPITEFLPSVRVGWGVSLNATLARVVDVAWDAAPVDPRVRDKALSIVLGVSPASIDDRARRLYRWVVENIQDGKDSDGRRVVMGGSGSRQAAFRYLLRSIGIDSQLALVKNRLAAPPLGAMSEVEMYDALVMRLATDHGIRWLTVHDKFAPYGYVPAELRDQSAIILVPDMPHEVVHATGALDGVAYDGSASLHEDGSAQMDLDVTFTGSRAIAWRSALDQVAPSKSVDFVERELIAPFFDGGHVREMKVEAAHTLDQPLVLHVRADVPELAKLDRRGLAVRPPFAPPLAHFAALPSRQTPLLRRTSWHVEVRIRVALPDLLRARSDVLPWRDIYGDAVVSVADKAEPHSIRFDRVIDIPAGRVAPGEPYAAWQNFVRRAGDLIGREILVSK